MRHGVHQRPAQLCQAVPGLRRPKLCRQRPQDRPVFLGLSRREPGAQRQLRAAFGVHEQAVFLGIGRPRQDQVGAVCAPVAMAALRDHEFAGADVNLIRAQGVDHLGPVRCRTQPTLGGAAHVQRAHARRRRVQDQQPRTRSLCQRHRLRQHRLAIGLGQRPLPDDHDPGLVQRLCLGRQPHQRRAPGAGMGHVIGQVRRRSHQRHNCAQRPGLADARVQNRRFQARVGADQDNGLGRVDILDPRGADIGRPVAGGQLCPIYPRLDRAAQPFDQLLQREGRLDRHQIAHQSGNGLALHRRCRRCQRLGPGHRLQLARHAQVRPVQPLAAQPVPDKAGLVGNPFLVHAVMVARQDAHHFAALGIDADIGPQPIHHIDGLGLRQFPWPGGEGIGL